MNNPLTPFLQRGALILDGGLATELEARGYDLNDPLWSARLLLENPAAIQAIHADYLAAGADCIISAGYQATLPGLLARGLTADEARRLIVHAVQLALAARDEFWAGAGTDGRLRPLVAASVGPYGAYLADGSEYTGRYGLSTAALADFHRERLALLAASGADLLACETLPALPEAEALLQLLRDHHPQRAAWFSFTCPDGDHISDGTPVATVARLLDQAPQVVAVGVNCSAPSLIPALIAAFRAATDKPIVIYPNSGETYDVAGRCWLGESPPLAYGDLGRRWHAAGAALIGGCCRTAPEHIRAIRAAFFPTPSD